MKRAAVIIAARKTASPQLQELKAAASSADKVVAWAESQGFITIVRLTDETGPLEVKTIKQAVRAIVDDGTVEQLFIYFSGHGVNLFRNEYWLLSGAPDDPQESINVSGSVELARYCGIPHVIFLSDACRTPAVGLQAQANSGSQIFPNPTVSGPENHVDMFFACLLGDPALEVADRDKSYQAVYTEALVEGLRCDVPSCLEDAQIEGRLSVVVRAWPLRDYLTTAVPRRLLATSVPPTFTQIPDARITSPPRAWLAEKPVPATSSENRPPPLNTVPSDPISPLLSAAQGITGSSVMENPRRDQPRSFIDPVRGIETDMTRADQPSEQPAALGSGLHAIFRTEAGARSVPFGRGHFESGCGFKVQGAELTESFHPSGDTGLAGPDSAWVRPKGPMNVVLRFSNGIGVVLPAIPEFVAGLSFEGTDLINVVYEPASGSVRWRDYEWEVNRLRRLRGRIAAASRLGIFQPVGEGVGQLAREMQSGRSLDPTMALYAAYGYHAVQETKKIVEMEAYLLGDLGFRFFDLALMAGTLGRPMNRPILPATPLLSQGWALLSARNVTLPPCLERLPAHLTPSLWSTFDPEGVEILKQALIHGELSP